MIGKNITISGQKAENRKLGIFEDGQCISHRSKNHKVKFRLYPIGCYTGVVANAKYDRYLEILIDKHMKHRYTKSNYKIGRMSEGYERCPEGYSCKFIEMTVFVNASYQQKDKIIWFENERY